MPRGTLHVILTEAGDKGLTLSDGAEILRRESSGGVEAFTAVALPEGGDHELNPKATAHVVQAQIRDVAEHLADAGRLRSMS